VKPIATLANCAWLAASLPAWLRFRSALRCPAETQRRILGHLLKANAESAYGRAHGFATIRSYADFRERVPIVDYDEVEPWIARIMRGEQGVLTCEPVTRLVPTSGSTGGRKLIPYTTSFQNEINAAVGPWMADLWREHPSVPFGPAYWSISPAIRLSSNEESAVPIGFDDDSAYLGGLKQHLAEATFAVPSVLRRVSDVECSRYLTLLCLLREPDLRLISVWHPSFLALLLAALPIWWEELLHDLAHGGCRRASAFQPEICRALRAAPQPGRADDLRRANPTNPHALWPRLRVVSCWGDGPAALAAADLQPRLPHASIQSKGLLATEAFISIPFRARHPIAVTSHFFEFADAKGATLLAHELRRGESYEVIVTTAGGLWRYRLGDLVEVDGFVASTPSLRFLGRGASVSDLCGEKLAETFVARAIESACASCGFMPRFAMLAPDPDGPGRYGYTLFVEGNSPPELPVCLEKELRKNPHYALCRDLEQLRPLRFFEVTNGARIFCDAHVSENRRVGEIKPQALSQRTDWRNRFGRFANRGTSATFDGSHGDFVLPSPHLRTLPN
jgi:GH3 auxin-responsive promoter